MQEPQTIPSQAPSPGTPEEAPSTTAPTSTQLQEQPTQLSGLEPETSQQANSEGTSFAGQPVAAAQSGAAEDHVITQPPGTAEQLHADGPGRQAGSPSQAAPDPKQSEHQDPDLALTALLSKFAVSHTACHDVQVQFGWLLCTPWT